MKALYLSPLQVLVLLLGVLAMSGTAYAQDSDGLNPTTAVTIQYESAVEFSISLDQSAELVRAALFLRTTTTAQFRAHIAKLDPFDKARASISFEPHSFNLRPFAQIEYYWQIDLSDGRSLTTEPEQVTYSDPQYAWQELSGTSAAVHWVDGDLSWGQDLVAIADTALQDAQSLLAVPASPKRQVYIFPNQSALENELRQAGLSQVSAHALPDLGVVLAAGKSGPETLIRLEQEIPHELIHLLLYERMGSQMEKLPAWLNEGLATLYEQSPRPIYSTALDHAKDEGRLIDIQSLCASFPIAEEEKILAYAQSASFTNYLIDIYGKGGILKLLDAYEEGTTCAGGIQRIYQRSIEQLQAEWESTLSSQGALNFSGTTPTFIAIGTSLLLITMIAVWLLVRRTLSQRDL